MKEETKQTNIVTFKPTFSEFYPYESEAQYRVSKALGELQKAYQTETNELVKENIELVFEDFLDLQELIELCIEEEKSEASMEEVDDALKEEELAKFEDEGGLYGGIELEFRESIEY